MTPPAPSILAVAPELKLVGDWAVDVTAIAPSGATLKSRFQIRPSDAVEVTGERCEQIPDFNDKAWGGWQKGYALKGLKAQECAVKGALDAQTLEVVDAADLARRFILGTDFQADTEWGAVGRMPGGAMAEKQAVLVSYAFTAQRIDRIAIAADGTSLVLKPGTPHVCLPTAPALAAGEIAVASIYLPPGRLAMLGDENLYPITEAAFPEALAASAKASAERLLPRTMRKLREGGRLRILAWGDSVTAGSFLANAERERWQCQFVARLRDQYPKADIELVTEAWGGRNTASYLAEPPGAEHNYQEKVLGAKPDLIILEFVNDAGLNTAQVVERYARLLKDFTAIGAELIINTPHYVRPDWMGLDTQKRIDVDPREYVQALRLFAAANQVALADAAMRYGRLWRQGVPVVTLMSNNINHPNAFGMGIFADALINLFP